MASVDTRSAEPTPARAREERSASERLLVVEGLCREFRTRRVVDDFARREDVARCDREIRLGRS